GFKYDIKRMNYKIFDGNNYIDVKNKIIKESAILLTYDRTYLIEYNNRLLDARYNLDKFVVQFFYKSLNSLIAELQAAIAESYGIQLQVK
ncbi:MAG: hypothetical protein RLZZ466_456, partial [Bacteroidota bacterium]